MYWWEKTVGDLVAVCFSKAPFHFIIVASITPNVITPQRADLNLRLNIHFNQCFKVFTFNLIRLWKQISNHCDILDFGKCCFGIRIRNMKGTRNPKKQILNQCRDRCDRQ